MCSSHKRGQQLLNRFVKAIRGFLELYAKQKAKGVGGAKTLDTRREAERTCRDSHRSECPCPGPSPTPRTASPDTFLNLLAPWEKLHYINNQ